MEIDPSRASSSEVMADLMLTALPPAERALRIIGHITTMANVHNDKAVVELLKLLHKAYGEVNDKKSFIRQIKIIYWNLPDARVEMEYDRYDDKKSPHHYPILIESKKWILEKVAWEWQLDEYNDWDIECFRFLVAAYKSMPKDWQKHDGESEDETKARGRFISEAEQGKIEALLREKGGYKSKDIEMWLQQNWLPEEMAKILVIARARSGGRKLALRDMRYAELLEPLNPEVSSPAALDLHKNLCEKIRTLDLRVKELLKQMQDGWGLGAEKIGESEYVKGKIETIFYSLERISIIVRLFENCEVALAQDIYGRARRHIQAWKKKYGKELEKLNILLDVVGVEYENVISI